MKKTFTYAVLALGLAASLSEAAQITVDFNLDDDPLPYVEKGFEVTSPIGSVTDAVLNAISLEIGDEISFTRLNGEEFQFVRFDLYRHDTLHDTFDLIGFSNGVEIVDYGNFAIGGGEFFQSIPAGNATVIDELRIIGTGERGAGPAWDNFVFDVARNDPSPVPVPASLPLLFAGLGAFGLMRCANNRRSV